MAEKKYQDWTCNYCHKRVKKGIKEQPAPYGCPKDPKGNKKHLWGRIGAAY